ncbi:MAG TPA: hypothetical protein VHY09_08185 [Candidatus Methylacidiphilales bacterium]|jgi:hypothetical protein|nr:hypothetical protein [Candidatus Methylacidiphilales bacterium]
MKTLLSLLTAVGLTFGVAAAQDLSGNANNSVAGIRPGTDISGFRSPANLNQTPSESSKFPNTHPNLKPQLGGILVDGPTKYGAELINPAAPASYGYGEKYLSAPSSTYDLQHESGPAAHRDAGGFKLFSIEF